MIESHENWQVQEMAFTDLAGLFMVWNGVVDWGHEDSQHSRYLCRDGRIRYSPLPSDLVYPYTRDEVIASPLTGYFPTLEESEALLAELQASATP